MDGLISFLVSVFVVISLVNKAKKKTGKTAATPAQKRAERQKTMGMQMSEARQPAQPAVSVFPVFEDVDDDDEGETAFDSFAAAVSTADEHETEQHRMPVSGGMDASPVTGEGVPGIQPVVRTTMAPRVRVSPHLHSDAAGSMGDPLTEGFDPCHEDGLAEAVDPCTVAPDADSLYMPETSGEELFRFDRQSVLSGVIMKEILDRPAQCRR